MIFKPFDPLVHDIDYNSYLTVTELKEIINHNIFCTYNDINTEDDSVLENLLMNVSQIFDTNFSFIGLKYVKEQKLQFPRNFETYTINDSIKIAIAYIICMQKNSILTEFINKSYETQTQTEKLDVLSTTYFENKNIDKSVFVKHPYLKNLINDYISDYNMFASIKRG